MPLTTKQRRLLAEIEQIASASAMDHWNIADYDEEQRTIRLQMMKEQLVRSVIVMKYTFIDELPSNIICHKYFAKPHKKFRVWTHNLIQ